MKTINSSLALLSIVMLTTQATFAFYCPSTGCWPNRDPIGESGGANIYASFQNNPISFFDIRGLKCPDGKITFDGKGWELKSIYLITQGADEADGFGDYPGATITWKAKVKVVCQCACPQTKPGNRTSAYTFHGDIWIYKAGEGPIEIPTPTSLWELIGEGIAAVVDTNIPKAAAMDYASFTKLKNAVNDSKPKNPSDGGWDGGKSPCDSAN